MSATKTGMAASYGYNAQGERVKKTVDGVSTLFHYDQAGQLMAETDALGGLLQEYIYLDGLRLATVTAALPQEVITFVHTDHLGAPLALSDSVGAIQWQGSYDPYGKVTVAIDNVAQKLRFPGQYLDAETGLHYNYFRDYDPEIGRYLQSDPIGLGGGINTYGYVSGNPIRFIDHNGLAELPANPSGLGDGWVQDHGHRNPNGEKWNHPASGTSVEWHPGQKGKSGWGGKNHWHVNGGKKHLPPGAEVPDFPEDEDEGEGTCEAGSDCRQTAVKVIATGGAVYLVYRCVRMLPSLFPPLWPTIPANVVAP